MWLKTNGPFSYAMAIKEFKHLKQTKKSRLHTCTCSRGLERPEQDTHMFMVLLCHLQPVPIINIFILNLLIFPCQRLSRSLLSPFLMPYVVNFIHRYILRQFKLLISFFRTPLSYTCDHQELCKRQCIAFLCPSVALPINDTFILENKIFKSSQKYCYLYSA